MSVPKDYSKLNDARRLRRDMTPWERRLWYTFLRRYPVKFYKQRIIGHYIVDFYCASARLVIELDGSQHYDPAQQEYDRKRTAYLESLELAVLRFTNLEIGTLFQQVCEVIDRTVKARI